LDHGISKSRRIEVPFGLGCSKDGNIGRVGWKWNRNKGTRRMGDVMRKKKLKKKEKRKFFFYKNKNKKSSQ